jgi:hypothetical protein
MNMMKASAWTDDHMLSMYSIIIIIIIIILNVMAL